MNSHNAETKLTLADAVMLAFDYPDDLTCLQFTTNADERKATARLWVHLTAAQAGTSFEAIAGNEALRDSELFLMLNTPARMFVDWFRREDLEHFALTDATGGDAWACAALERARAMCSAMGPLALQVPMRSPVLV